MQATRRYGNKVGSTFSPVLLIFRSTGLIAGVPDDHPPTEPLGIPLLSVYYVVATIGLVYAATCFVFNTAFRNRK